MARGGSSEAFDGVHVPKRTRRLFLAVALLTLAVFLVSARGLPQTFDEQIVYDTTASLVHGTADIGPALQQQFPAGTAASRVAGGLSVTRSDGRRAGIYGLGTSAVGAPLYAIGKLIAEVSPASKRARIVETATLFTDSVLTAATVFVLMMLCLLLGAPPVGAVLIGLSFGLGSYAYPHALTMFTEPGTALCVIAAVFFAVRAARAGSDVDLFASGAFAATALLFRVSAALFLPIIGLWLLIAAWRSRDVEAGADGASSRRSLRRVVRFGAWYTVGAIGPLLLMFVVNWWRYGSVTNFGYALGTATNQSYPILRGVVNQWFSSGKSLFLYAPIALVVLFGLVRAARKAPMEIALLGSLVVVNTLFFARVQFWSGDWAWGPRYLQIVVPCLAAMAAPLMDRPAWRRAVVVVSVLGFFFAALPAVLVRFTLIFYSADKLMPSGPLGPQVWDHSYYALVWHTLHWQQILYQLRLLPHAFSNSLSHVTSPQGPASVSTFLTTPRLEFWWLRARDLGTAAVLLFVLFPIAVAVAGVRMLNRYLESAPDSAPAGVSGAV
jgi:hypothetical protein